MFTGIVERIGKVVRLERMEEEWRLTLQTGSLRLDDVKLGDSMQ